ncbi:ribosomal protein L37AE/L43A [Lederbergia galactosidilyticus]|uniref:NERD domain-containing protein n=1 Tax=Lederbergia galactosidilytica TaxID=217031 RepID=UPI000716F693|nr:NERD domain-containing protein [Lederbergia galactosidilytica]MBP1915442.1 ribosomal protein L37AE/L43A [Lederbergia galactosidilytica]
MIKKRRSKPLALEAIEAADRRLRENHRSKPVLIKEMNIRRAGYRGEMAMDYPLSFLNKDDYYILHDLRLPNHVGTYFQNDSILLSPSILIPLSVKNFRHKVIFEEATKQMIHHVDGLEQGYACPTIQADHHQTQLGQWLKINGFPQIPIQPLIAFSNPSTIIQINGDAHNYQHVFTSNQLPSKITQLEKSNRAKYLSRKKMNELSSEFIKQHTPLTYDIMKQFDIRPEEILTGVHCPDCGYLAMKREYGKWRCPKCQYTSKKAHIKALRDYFLLFNSSITNAECRRFLHLQSRHQARSLLNEYEVKKKGKTRGTKYIYVKGK